MVMVMVIINNGHGKNTVVRTFFGLPIRTMEMEFGINIVENLNFLLKVYRDGMINGMILPILLLVNQILLNVYRAPLVRMKKTMNAKPVQLVRIKI